MAITMNEAAKLAQISYQETETTADNLLANLPSGGWTIAAKKLSPGGLRGGKGLLGALAPPGCCTGFQGFCFARPRTKDFVFAIKGTKGLSKSGDWTSNLKIAMSMVPNQASTARSFFVKYRDMYKTAGYSVTVVGHSLGGGVAQCLGFWYSVPFVTFNAPGMARTLFLSTTLPMAAIKPMVWARTYGAANDHGLSKKKSEGVNFRLKNDFVSAKGSCGSPYGYRVTLPFGGWSGPAHAMANVVTELQHSRYGSMTLGEVIQDVA
jgi:hypothetical protein